MTTRQKKLNKLGKILNELTVLSEKGIEKVSSLEIESVVADDTGIPIGKIQAQEKDRLLGIETKLHERVKGQDKAIRTLSDAIIESRSGLSDRRNLLVRSSSLVLRVQVRLS